MARLSRCLSLLILLFIAHCSASASSPFSHSYQRNSLFVQVDTWGISTARVRISPTAIIDDPQPQALSTFPPSDLSPSSLLSEAASGSSYAIGELTLNISADGAILVSAFSQPLLASDPPSFAPYKFPSEHYSAYYPAYYTVTLSSLLLTPAKSYALGEHHHGREELAYADYAVNFSLPETVGLKGDIPIPWTLHSSGLAMLWNHAGWGGFEVSGGERLRWTAIAAPQLDVLLSVAAANGSVSPFPTLLQAMLTATDSFPAPLPHYASGFWQCKLRYRTQEEVLAVAKGYVDRQYPLSVLVIDAGHWAELGDFSFDPKCFPDPQSMVLQLRQWGVELMVSMWPHAAALSSNFPFMREQGFLTHDHDGRWLNYSIPWMPWPPGSWQPDASAVDFLSPAASAYMAELITRNYIDYGIRMFWLDADEPDCALPGRQWWAGRSDVEVESTYPLGVIRTVHQALRNAGVQDGMMLSRDSWVGGNSLGAAVWSGDIVSTFAELRRQVLVSQNVALSGIYHWTTDVGGFIGGWNGDPMFEQLLVRWFQFGAFCPIFRTHGDRNPGLPDNGCGTAGAHTEIWAFQHEPILADLLRLREKLRPYIEHHLQQAAVSGVPLLQPMFFAFTDAECFAAESQFMFGPQWLVAPVLQENATVVDVYLPAVSREAVQRLRASRRAVGETVRETGRSAAVWQHYYSGKQYAGGQWLQVQTELSDFPLFQLVETVDDAENAGRSVEAVRQR